MNQTNQSVDKLNEFLRGEISAVETYRQALDKISSGGTRLQLEQCRRSHEERVALLQRSITSSGGEPASTSGAWGSFAKLAEGSAKVFGEKAAIAALEEGEDRGLKLYQNDLEKLDPSAQELVRTDSAPRPAADASRAQRFETQPALRRALGGCDAVIVAPAWRLRAPIAAVETRGESRAAIRPRDVRAAPGPPPLRAEGLDSSVRTARRRR